jgi:Phage integrase family
MLLQTLLDSALASGQVKPSRVGPLKTAIKQYAAMFGKDAADLSPHVYHKSPEAIGDWCEQHASETLGPRGLANLKNNIRWLLNLGVEQKWLLPIVGDIVPWHLQHKLPPGRLRRPHAPGELTVERSGYRLLMPADRSKPIAPWMAGVVKRQQANLQVIPDGLLAELNAYLAWCMREYAPDRPAKIKKRQSSAHLTSQAVCAVGGYAVHILGQPLASLSLARCTDPELVNMFVDWWVNTRRQRITRTITDLLAHLATIAKYWLKDSARAEALYQMRMSLGQPPAVFDKSRTVLSLREIERVGRSIYPLNEERLKSSRYARAVARHIRDPERFPMRDGRSSSFTKTAWKAQMSLLIRLLVRIPLRQRNLREMKLGHNLKRTADGRWEIHFRGKELKVAMRQGREHEVRYLFPEELCGQLDEFLTIWRPYLLGQTVDCQVVFLNRQGQPLTSNHLCSMYTKAVYRVLGKYTTIHLARDAWASDYLDATGDIAGAADRLGDNPKTVMDHYAHILKQRTQDRTGLWISNHLS